MWFETCRRTQEQQRLRGCLAEATLSTLFLSHTLLTPLVSQPRGRLYLLLSRPRTSRIRNLWPSAPTSHAKDRRVFLSPARIFGLLENNVCFGTVHESGGWIQFTWEFRDLNGTNRETIESLGRRALM